MKAYQLDQATGQVKLEDPKNWSVAETFAAKDWDTYWNERKILTYMNEGRVFIWDDMASSQKDALDRDENIVDYIRGKDVSGFRQRTQKLGDIVHSAAVFEDDVLYAGANDGMLHAFDVTNKGEELFAYVPYLVYGHLKELPKYDYTHKYYVDLTPTVKKGEGLLGGTQTATILVGGLGKGGKGYFALDITYPRAMTESDVLWEFPKSPAGDDDMGYSFSKPVVVQSNSNKQDESWIVIFGNGYESSNQKSVLFIREAKSGKEITKIEAGEGPDNGLSSPIAVDVNFDDKVDFVYAGDLHGNLWKFDLTSDDSRDWDVAFKNGSSPAPLFTALDPAGNPQPVTTKPDVMFHPDKHGYVVAFGTGKFLHENDFNDTNTQTLYGIWDYGDRVFTGSDWSDDDNSEYLGAFESRSEDEAVRQLSNSYLSEKVKLLKQVAKDEDVTLAGGTKLTVRILTTNQPSWKTVPDEDADQRPNPSDATINHAGWYLDLGENPGERVVSNVIIRGGILIAIGYIPSTERCDLGGDSVFMELNAFTGGRLSSVQFDINGDNQIDKKDLVPLTDENGVPIVDANGYGIEVPPSGLKLPGKLQPPIIIRLDEAREKKYFSSSENGITEIAEKAVNLGISYLQEVRRE